MDGSIGKKYLQDYLVQTDLLFAELLDDVIQQATKIDELIVEMLKRFKQTACKGKKIRGALAQLGYQIARGQDKMAIQKASLTLELFHAAVLVQDDVMDQDNMRRGLSSLHHQFAQVGRNLYVGQGFDRYGESTAICIADAVFYISWMNLFESGFSPHEIINAARIYADYIPRVAYGQILDITNTSVQKISEERVLRVLRYKTAEYTAVLPLLFGAALAGDTDQKRQDAIKGYGLAFGWAFQIQDDILGLFGEVDQLGKPVGSDLKEGKNTLLMLYLQKKGTDQDREFQQNVLGNEKIGFDEVIEMRERVKESGAYDEVVGIAKKYVEAGIRQIPEVTPEPRYQEILESLIIYMIERIS